MFHQFIPDHFQTQHQPSMPEASEEPTSNLEPVQMGGTNTVVTCTSQQQSPKSDHSGYSALRVSIFINSRQ